MTEFLFLWELTLIIAGDHSDYTRVMVSYILYSVSINNRSSRMLVRGREGVRNVDNFLGKLNLKCY